ncbi:MAG: flavin reductase family protein [Pseudohongiellaceae bacterium]|jgi:flavin reductase (DIM6/NTAB) family NADH-FMN oxidoreductase RutF
MIVYPSDSRPNDMYKLMVGSITPRPIALVSSISKAGVFNLAPYSFFTGVSANPPAIGFSPLITGKDKIRDSRNNIEETKEFAVNIVSESLVEQMNVASSDVPPEVDEFALSQLTPAHANIVSCPLVKESRINMECRLIEIVEVSNKLLGGAFILGEIVCFHIDDEVVENFRIDPDTLDTVGRMGGSSYTRTRDRFELVRPDSKIS